MISRTMLAALALALLFTVSIESAGAHAADGEKGKGNSETENGGSAGDLRFDTIKSGYSEVIVTITLPDGGKVTRVTEPLPGRDGKEGGFRKLVGYKLPDGTVVEKDIRRNSDGTVSVLDLNADGRSGDRHEKRMSQQEFIKWVKDQQQKK